MCFMTLEDLTGAIEVVVFPDVFAAAGALLEGDDPIVVQGTVQQDDGQQEDKKTKIIADAVVNLAQGQEKYTEGAVVKLLAQQADRRHLDALRGIFSRYQGNCPVVLTLHFDARGEVDLKLPEHLFVRPCREMADEVAKTLGYEAVTYTRKAVEITAGNRKNGPRRSRENN